MRYTGDRITRNQRGELSTMNDLSRFCTCKNLACPLHPTRHDKGCAPCIQKNLKLREVPNCFFQLLPGAEGRPGDSFEDFARLVQAGQPEE